MENFLPSMWKVRELADKVTNVVMNYTEVEAKVREATNDEPWGPTGQIMQELAHSTFTYEHFPEVMSMLWKRMLQDNKQHWRRTYKSLLVLQYLIKNGSERVVTSAREHIYDLRSLENYTYIDDVGKDQGVNIRHKVKEMIDFIQDDDRLREERKKAKKNKDKFIGMSSDTIGMRFGSGRDTWDDKPYSRDAQDWDDTNSPSRYRDKSLDDDYDLEKEDSDTESRSSSNNHSNNIKKYQDTELPNSPTHVEKKVNININTSLTSSPKKANKPLKKVDLGAAANFGRDSSQSPIPPTSNDLLNDDFNPRAQEVSNDRKASDEFGDFETVFPNNPSPAQKSEDQFADFGSAFSQTPAQNTSQYSNLPNLLGPGPHVLPNVIPPSTNAPNLLLSNDLPNLLGGPPASNLGPPLNNFGQQSQSFMGVSSVPVQSSQKTSNSDLLGDLDFGSLTIQPQNVAAQPNNNFGLLGSPNANLLDDLSTGTEKDDTLVTQSGFGEQLSDISRKPGDTAKNRRQKELIDLMFSCIKIMELAKKFTSQAQVDVILQQIDEIVSLLPGPLTPQKLVGIDSESFSERVESSYEVFIDLLVQHFDTNFPFQGGNIHEPIKKLFEVEDPKYFNVNFRVLVENLTNSEPIVMLLQLLLESEGTFTMICSQTLETEFPNKFVKEELTASWEGFVKRLIYLPNRVANVAKGNVPYFFVVSSFTKYILLNILKAVEGIAEILRYDKQKESYLNFENISYLLGKVLVNFNQKLESEGLQSFTEIVSLLTNKVSAKMKLYQRIFQSIFANLDRSAVYILANMFLNNIEPEKYSIKEIFGKKLIEDENWKFVLCTKIPLLTHFEKNYSNLIANLVVYLSSSSPALLMKLFFDLVTIWADKSSINHTSVEQQMFVVKLMIFIANSLQNIGLTAYEIGKIKEKVFSGIPVHLESSIELVRASGMKAGEIIMNMLNKEDEKSETELKFEYNNLSDECKKVIKELQDIADRDIQDYFIARLKFDTTVESEMVKLIIVQEKNIEYIPPPRKFVKTAVLEEPKNEVIITERKTDSRIKIIDRTNFELDSDDDLEPYDLSNDIKVSKKNPPAYLRDLRDGLLETQDQEIFVLSLENCEDIITKQLPDDDCSIGLEILEVLISLEQRFFVENFEDLVFQSCVGITYVYPAYYTEYLCKQIHADVGTYSISKRIFMLDILKQTAKNLSNIKRDGTSEERKTKRQEELESAEEVIRKRLQSKTRYFAKHNIVIKREQVNKFSEVAGSFFFPLLYGFSHNKLLNNQFTQSDSDFIFLIHFIETLAVIMCASQNCPIAPRMAKEIFHFSWFLRFHKEVKVRISILSLISAAIVNVPHNILVQDYLNELFEIRLWLADLLSPNVARGEPNLECRSLAACAMVLVEGVLKVDIETDER
ncbi:hypothetical protein JTB14_011023 [Gonioctena quinquepunctata]|nr:hypothetical protein JTB14_011023 [Gonioctena quinquepunctata]